MDRVSMTLSEAFYIMINDERVPDESPRESLFNDSLKVGLRSCLIYLVTRIVRPFHFILGSSRSQFWNIEFPFFVIQVKFFCLLISVFIT